MREDAVRLVQRQKSLSSKSKESLLKAKVVDTRCSLL